MSEHVLARYVPVGVTGPTVALADLGAVPFEEAFLIETVAASQGRPIGLSIEALADRQRAPSPIVVIAHTGRSGSTLLCRMLDGSGALASYREPEALLDALDAHGPWGASVVLAQLAWHAGAQGRRAAVKLPSHAHHLLRTAPPPPSTSVVILVRDPVEVASSVLADPPAWLGPVGRAEALERVVAVWNGVADLAADPYLDPLVVRYPDLVAQPEHTLAAVLAHAGVAGSVAEAAAWHQRDAKSARPWPGPRPPVLDARERTLVRAATAAHAERIGLEVPGA